MKVNPTWSYELWATLAYSTLDSAAKFQQNEQNDLWDNKKSI